MENEQLLVHHSSELRAILDHWKRQGHRLLANHYTNGSQHITSGVDSQQNLVSPRIGARHRYLQDIEDQNSPEDTTHSLGNVSSWVLGLSSSNGNHLDTTIRESRIDQHGKETEESTCISL